MDDSRRTRPLQSIWRLCNDSYRAWSEDRAIRLGAGLAYYSLFALIPVLALAVSLASLFFGQEQVSQDVYTAISDVVGPDLANLIITGIDEIGDDPLESIAPLISFGVLVFTATLLFVAWRDVVSILWDLPRRHGMRAALRRRGFAVAAVFGAGVLLTLALFAQALIASIADVFAIDLIGALWTVIGSLTSTAMGAVFLAVLYKFSPGVNVEWRSVWLPAAVTTVALSIGAHGYGFYVERVGLSSAAGVAGTVFLGLAFVYYAAQILLYGVEMVKVAHMRISTRATDG